MIKLYKKNKKLINSFVNYTNQYFLLKLFIKNKLLNTLIKYNLILIQHTIFKKFSKVKIINKCCISINKKRFNNITLYSRFIFKKIVLNGKLFGITKY